MVTTLVIINSNIKIEVIEITQQGQGMVHILTLKRTFLETILITAKEGPVLQKVCIGLIME